VQLTADCPTAQLPNCPSEAESQNYGYKFGQNEETYNIMAAQGYFGLLIFQYACFNNSRSLHFFLAAWPEDGIGSLPWALSRRVMIQMSFLEMFPKARTSLSAIIGVGAGYVWTTDHTSPASP
jgi:hypothetical protein